MEIVKVLSKDGKKSKCLLKQIVNNEMEYSIVAFNGFSMESKMPICENTYKWLKGKTSSKQHC